MLRYASVFWPTSKTLLGTIAGHSDCFASSTSWLPCNARVCVRNSNVRRMHTRFCYPSANGSDTKRPRYTGKRSARDDLDFAVDAVDDVEGPLEHLALVPADGAAFAFRQHHARK